MMGIMAFEIQFNFVPLPFLWKIRLMCFSISTVSTLKSSFCPFRGCEESIGTHVSEKSDDCIKRTLQFLVSVHVIRVLILTSASCAFEIVLCEFLFRLDLGPMVSWCFRLFPYSQETSKFSNKLQSLAYDKNPGFLLQKTHITANINQFCCIYTYP